MGVRWATMEKPTVGVEQELVFILVMMMKEISLNVYQEPFKPIKEQKYM